MTAQQETLFICDRCTDRHVEPLTNTPAPTRGLIPPKSWTTVWVNEITRAPRHLCPDCTHRFNQFLSSASS